MGIILRYKRFTHMFENYILRSSSQNKMGALSGGFLEVDLQRSTYIVFAFVVLHSRGGPGSWLMHFPYVVLHGCFGFF